MSPTTHEHTRALSPEDRLLTVAEVAQRCRAARGTVRHWLYTGRLPSLKVGRRRLVREAALVAFLNACESAGSRGQR